MLVHVSQRTVDQSRIADSIRGQLDLWREAERQGQRLDAIFGQVWDGMKVGIDVAATDQAVVVAAIRPSTQGLLLIYPLDPTYLGIPQNEPVIALALSLPRTSDEGTSWIVNSMVSDD